jgi:hypothetical protein
VNITIEEKLNKLTVYDKEFEQMCSFTHLAGVVTKDGGTDEDVRSRIRKANGAFLQ